MKREDFTYLGDKTPIRDCDISAKVMFSYMKCDMNSDKTEISASLYCLLKGNGAHLYAGFI